MKMFSARRGALALGLVAGLAVLPAMAADKDTKAAAGGKDPVVAVVNGTQIKASAVAAYQRTLPPQLAMQAPFDDLLDMVVTNHLIFEQAKKDKTLDEPEVKDAIRQFERQMAVKAWMNKKLRAEVTEEAVKTAYDAALKDFKPETEVRARHILTETEDQAKEVIAELAKGAEFDLLARARSKDPSVKQNGGDVGYFGKAEMVPEFAEAAFAMKPGELSKTPVKSQFGWHVIKVEDTRMSSPPTLDQARPVLREQVAEKIAERIVADMRSKAKIDTRNPDGSAKN